MALAEDRWRDTGSGSPDGGLGRLATQVDHGGDIHDGYTSNHGPTLANPTLHASRPRPWPPLGTSRPRSTCRGRQRSRSYGPSGCEDCLDRSRNGLACWSVRAIRRFTVRPVLPEPLGALGELAGNLRWSWHPPTQDLFASIDAELWDARSGATRCACSAPSGRERLDELADDGDFLARLRAAARRPAALPHRGPAGTPARPATTRRAPSPTSPRSSASPRCCRSTPAASASWPATTSRRPATSASRSSASACSTATATSSSRSSRDGWQQESYPVLDPDELPLSLLREADGSRATVSIALPGGPDLVARIWRGPGRPRAAAAARHRHRGEPRRTTATSPTGSTAATPSTGCARSCCSASAASAPCGCGRASPAPRRRRCSTPTRATPASSASSASASSPSTRPGRTLDFDTALEVSRAGTVFTTHTPVPAGIDRFPRELVAQYFGGDSPTPGVPVDRILALGAEDYDGGDAGVFNMAVMGLRLAQRANGVSQLHGHVSAAACSTACGRRSTRPRCRSPRSPTASTARPGSPARSFELAADARRRRRLRRRRRACGRSSTRSPAREIWDLKRTLRDRLVDDARDRLRQSRRKRGARRAELGWIDSALDPDVLTIGFARRVPSYKRLTLMLRDPERLKRCCSTPSGRSSWSSPARRTRPTTAARS